ncbi:tRNA (cytidine-2'-O-)-methyltransferase TrmJ [Stygiolobus caldivivus]|uniref:RNA methyltransferase n=1 Tax=Stygiolobus caldivivus TaxID=2824673 RepID=A0A8D5U8A3_9CREN|nr:tRNA (cytidine-2'-O-)-methyltransferase TrmJ [Stygiolobus caldivivus]BCU70611.1 RNA methyltransferase [Stygiolobus caldivivus]
MIRLIVVEPEGSYNVGFIARLVKNFEVDEFYLVNPKCKMEEAINFSAQGRDILEKKALIVSAFDDAIKDLDIKIATSSIADNEGDLLRRSIKPWEIGKFISDDKKIGLIFGRESVGLTREEIFKSDFLLHIPGNPAYPVLNLSHAVSIVLYEVYKLRTSSIKNENISNESIKLMELYSRKIIDSLKRSEGDEYMYVVLKRVLLKGVSSEIEAKTIVRLLRKIYVKISIAEGKKVDEIE